MKRTIEEQIRERIIYPPDCRSDEKERIIIPQQAIGLTADDWLARKSILTEKARLWIVGEANKERAAGTWSEEQYAFFKREIRQMEPTPLRELMKGDVVISTRCEKGGYCHNYVLNNNEVTGFSNHSSCST